MRAFGLGGKRREFPQMTSPTGNSCKLVMSSCSLLQTSRSRSYCAPFWSWLLALEPKGRSLNFPIQPLLLDRPEKLILRLEIRSRLIYDIFRALVDWVRKKLRVNALESFRPVIASPSSHEEACWATSTRQSNKVLTFNSIKSSFCLYFRFLYIKNHLLLLFLTFHLEKWKIAAFYSKNEEGNTSQLEKRRCNK